MPTTTTNVSVTRDADRRLRKFAKHLENLTPFWATLAEHLADDAQARWPLRDGTPARSESRWSGAGHAWAGAASMNPPLIAWRLERVCFTAGLRSTGRRRQRKTPLIHVDADDARTRLSDWMRARAEASGLEVDMTPTRGRHQTNH